MHWIFRLDGSFLFYLNMYRLFYVDTCSLSDNGLRRVTLVLSTRFCDLSLNSKMIQSHFDDHHRKCSRIVYSILNRFLPACRLIRFESKFLRPKTTKWWRHLPKLDVAALMIPSSRCWSPFKTSLDFSCRTTRIIRFLWGKLQRPSVPWCVMDFVLFANTLTRSWHYFPALLFDIENRYQYLEQEW